MLYNKETILQLIPQRNPIIMVHDLVDAEGDICHTTLSVEPDNFFMEDDGKMSEAGLIEHIAQSASAFAGYRCAIKNEPAPVGYIGEVKNFHCYARPAAGSILETEINFGAEVNGITIMSGSTKCNGELIADTKMKIFVTQE